MPRHVAVRLALVLGLQWASAVVAAPVTLTVDPSASHIADQPLIGTVKGGYDASTKELTFGGGSAVVQPLPLSGHGTLRDQVSVSGPTTVAVTDGTFRYNLSALQMDLAAGTIANGSSAATPHSTVTAGTGSVSGSANVRVTLTATGTELVESVVSFSGLLLPRSPFESSAALPPVQLSDAESDLKLKLFFALPLTLTNPDVDVSNPLLVNFIVDLVEHNLFATVDDIAIPGVVVASQALDPGASVPEPTPAVCLGLGLMATGIAARRTCRGRDV